MSREAREISIVDGREGMLVATIDGNVHEIPETVKVTAKMEVTLKEWNQLNFRGTRSKPKGWKGTGTLTVRYGKNIFRQIMYVYAKTGKMPKMSIYILNSDPTAEEIKTILYNVMISSLDIAQLDVDSDTLNQEIPFTFDDWEDL